MLRTLSDSLKAEYNRVVLITELMSFRRDGISSGVEISGDLDEILERKGDSTHLEDLRQHLNNPARQRDMLQKWLHEQEHWMQKLPQILESFHKEQKDIQEVILLLENINIEQENDLSALMTFLGLEDSKDAHAGLLNQLRMTLQKHQEIRSKMAQELPENSSQISRLLNNNLLAQRLERTTEVEEAADPLA
jgi:hypothetical protein